MFGKYLLLLFSIIVCETLFPQTVETFSTPGSYTWVCPANVTELKVQCWGAGGGGGGSNNSTNYGGQGGGGGAYAESTISVIPGYTYYYFIGDGGLGAKTTIPPGDGGSTCFTNEYRLPVKDSCSVLAAGGIHGLSNSNSGSNNRGDISLSIGAIKYSGGIGGYGLLNGGRAGGASAGTSNNGSDGFSSNVGINGGGAGGNGSLSANIHGANGENPGGGGCGVDDAKTSYGGNGGSGKMILSYTPLCNELNNLNILSELSTNNQCGDFSIYGKNIPKQDGLIYRWHLSSDSLNWIPISNSNNDTIYQNDYNTLTFYRLIVSCKYSKDSVLSSISKRILNPEYLKKGIISPNQTICSGSFPEIIEIKNYKGKLNWQSSTDSINWSDLPYTDTNLYIGSVGQLSTNNYYRAKLSNNTCGSIFSEPTKVIVLPQTTVGTLSTYQTICKGDKIKPFEVYNSIGEVQWQMSTNDIDWININNATKTVLNDSNVGNLNVTSFFRIIAKSAVCKSDTSKASTRVTVNEPTIVGTITPSQFLCQGDKMSTLKVSNYRATNFSWQYNNSDTTNYAQWSGINNSNLDSLTSTQIGAFEKRYFRCKLNNGSCPEISSKVVTISFAPPSLVSSIINSQQLCQEQTPENVVFKTYKGDSIHWEYSFDQQNWNIYKDANSNTLLNSSIVPLYQNTYIRAFVKNSVCSAVYSNIQTIQVDVKPIAGRISFSQEICTGTKPADISINNYFGDNFEWYYSTPTNIKTNKWTNYSLYYNDTLYASKIGVLNEERYFKAIVYNGSCDGIETEIDTIRLTPLSTAGTISSNQLICSGTYPTDISVTGGIGNLTWQKSTNANAWTDIPNSSDGTLSSNKAGIVSTPTYYRGVQTSGKCASVYTPMITVNTDSVSYAGATSSNQSLCTGTSSGLISVTKPRGTLQWQISTNGVTFNNITSATTTSYSPGLLASTTYYRMRAINGVCSAAYSAPIQITIAPKSIIGTLSANQTICSGAQPSNINLSNANGTISWQSSLNNTTWSSVIGVTGTTLTSAQMGNLTSQKYYRATVKSGACTGVTSNTINIGIRANPIVSGGTNQSICPNTSISLAGSGAVSYTWSDGIQNNVLFTPSVTKTYTVTGIDTYGCSNSAQVTVAIYPSPSAEISNITSGIICQGTPFNLISSSNNVSSYQWKWNDNLLNGATNASLNSKNTGNYSLTVQSLNGCKSESNSLYIQTQALPLIEAGVNQSICLGEKVQLLATKATNLQWNNGIQNGDSITPTSSAYYKVTTTDMNGCSNSDSILIKVNNPSSSTLKMSTFGSYQMNNELFTKSGTYTQIIPNKAGCDSTITLNLVVESLGMNNLEYKDLKIYPNPTPDGKFFIQSDYEIYEIRILNSEGKVLDTLKNEKEIDISRFGRGVYFVEVKRNNFMDMFKVVY